MFVVEQTQPHTSQVGGVPEKERTVLQLPQDKYSVIFQPTRLRLRLKRALHSSQTFSPSTMYFSLPHF